MSQTHTVGRKNQDPGIECCVLSGPIQFDITGVICSLCSPATGRPRERGGADQPGREPALRPAGRSVEPLPAGRRSQPSRPLLPGPGAPHTPGESAAPPRAHATLGRPRLFCEHAQARWSSHVCDEYDLCWYL